MLIRLRDKENKLVIKDYLDIDFNMKIEQRGKEYFVKVNRSYYLDSSFENETEAENAMVQVADCRNGLEQELRNY